MRKFYERAWWEHETLPSAVAYAARCYGYTTDYILRQTPAWLMWACREAAGFAGSAGGAAKITATEADLNRIGISL